MSDTTDTKTGRLVLEITARFEDALRGLDKAEKGAEKVRAAGKKMGEGVSDGAKEGGKALDELGNKAESAGRKTSAWGKVLSGVLLGLGLGIAQLARRGVQLLLNMGQQAIQMSADFQHAMARVSTLVDTSVVDMDRLSDHVLALSKRVPKSATELADGLFYVINSGVRNTSDAMKVLEIAAKAAIAGVTDLTTAADGITTVLNAYQMRASEAGRVSDILFETVRLGKTDFVELSNNIGKVTTTAALAKVKFEEVGAAMGTLTKFGIKAPEAAQSLNRLLLTVVSPTKRIREEAKRLGIEWSSSAIEARGFAGWLKHVHDKTNGNIDALARLNPNIRAARSAFVLAGKGAADFAYNVEAMSKSTDAAEIAYRKVQGAVKEQWELMKNRYHAALIQLGEIILPMIGEELVLLGADMDDFTDRIDANQKEIGAWARFLWDLTKSLVGTLGIVVKTAWNAMQVGAYTIGALLSKTVEGMVTLVEKGLKAWNALANGINKLGIPGLSLRVESSPGVAVGMGSLPGHLAGLRAGAQHFTKEFQSAIGKQFDDLGNGFADYVGGWQQTGRSLAGITNAGTGPQNTRRRRRTDTANWPPLDPEDGEDPNPTGDGDGRGSRSRREAALRYLREAAADAAILKEFGDYARLDEIPGRLGKAVGEVMEVDKQIRDLEQRIVDAGGAHKAPDAALAQLASLKKLREERYAYAQELKTDPESLLSEKVLKARDSFNDLGKEIELLRHYGLNSLAEAPQPFLEAIRAGDEYRSKIKQVRGAIRELAGDKSVEAAAERKRGEELLAYYEEQAQKASTLARSFSSYRTVLKELNGLGFDFYQQIDPAKAEALASGMQGYADALGRVREAEVALDVAKHSRDRDAQRVATDKLKAAQAELRAQFQAVVPQLTKYGLSSEQVAKVLDELTSKASALNTELDGHKVRYEKLANVAGQFAAAAKEVESFVNALGELDDQSRDTLAGLTQMLDGIAKGLEGMASGDPMKMLSGALGLASGAMKAGNSLAVSLGIVEDKQLHSERQKALLDLTQALKSLEKSIISHLSTNTVREDIGSVKKAGDILVGRKETFSGYGPTRRGALYHLAHDLGVAGRGDSKELSIEKLKVWAAELDQKYGTNLQSFVERSDPKGMIEALRLLQAQLGREVTEMGQFTTDVGGTIQRINYELAILGETDAASKIQAITKALLASSNNLGEFKDELEELAGLDLSTDEGMSRRDEIVRYLLERMQAGDVNFGDMTPEEFREILQEWSRAQVSIGSGGANSVNHVNTITSGQANIWISNAMTQTSLQREIRDDVRALLHELRDGGTAGSPGGAVVQINNPQLNVSLAAPGLTPSNAQEVADKFGRGALDAMYDEAQRRAKDAGAQRGDEVILKTKVK